MRRLCFYILFLAGFAASAQDRVCFLDGSCRSGKVTEIGIDEIKMQTAEGLETYPKYTVLLVEFKDGRFEKYNDPDRNVVYRPEAAKPIQTASPEDRLFGYNHISLNTLALCNSDISGFYERIVPSKKFGFGAMAAYNFNPEASLLNMHIFLLSNGKKNYDLGVFGNYYFDALSETTSFYMGMLFKYTSLSYMSVTNDSALVGNVYVTNTRFTPATGMQLATVFTCGTHTKIAGNFFIKTMAGLGGFNLHGNYQQQYNLQYNAGVNAGSRVQRHFLLKMYFAVNAGFSF